MVELRIDELSKRLQRSRRLRLQKHNKTEHFEREHKRFVAMCRIWWKVGRAVRREDAALAESTEAKARATAALAALSGGGSAGAALRRMNSTHLQHHNSRFPASSRRPSMDLAVASVQEEVRASTSQSSRSQRAAAASSGDGGEEGKAGKLSSSSSSSSGLTKSAVAARTRASASSASSAAGATAAAAAAAAQEGQQLDSDCVLEWDHATRSLRPRAGVPDDELDLWTVRWD